MERTRINLVEGCEKVVRTSPWDRLNMEMRKKMLLVGGRRKPALATF
jgi:hypothetical protein